MRHALTGKQFCDDLEPSPISAVCRGCARSRWLRLAALHPKAKCKSHVRRPGEALRQADLRKARGQGSTTMRCGCQAKKTLIMCMVEKQVCLKGKACLANGERVSKQKTKTAHASACLASGLLRIKRRPEAKACHGLRVTNCRSTRIARWRVRLLIRLHALAADASAKDAFLSDRSLAIS